MSTPFTVSGTLQLPPAPGLAVAPLPLAVSGVFDSEADFTLNLSGSGTQVVDLGTIAGAGVKGLLITVDPNSTGQNITVKINGSSTGGIEISPAGGMLYANPVPSAGITGLQIVYATACTVRIWAIG